jgi:hypothetical protein
MNDGLAFPFILLGISIAGSSGTAWLAEWVLADVLYAVGGAALTADSAATDLPHSPFISATAGS